MQTVVLAAGRGTRMGPLSAATPKPLLPVGDRPLVAHPIEAAAEAGASEFVVVTGYRGEKIKERLGSTYRGVPITYVAQAELDGTASAVAAAAEAVDGTFAVLNGDCLYRPGDMKALFENGPGIGIVDVTEPDEYGIVSLENGHVTEIIEKPTEPPSTFANTGAYVFPPDPHDALDVAASDRGEYELTDAVATLVETREIAAVEFDGWRDVGRPWELLEANETVLSGLERTIDGDVHPDATITGPVVVEPGATVREGATIEGPALLRSGSEVGPNAYVRGATLLEEDVNVGHGVEIKNSVIMRDASVPHLSYVGDSIVGPEANLGAGTTIANLRHDREPVEVTVKGERVSTGREKFGAVLGPRVRTGVNTSINPGVTLSADATTLPGETVTRDR